MLRIKIENFSFGDELVLKDIDQQFEPGKSIGIVGLNGAGKTTLFNLMAGYIKTENHIFTNNGKKIKQQDIAFLDTELYIYPKITGKEFLSVFPETSSSYNEDSLAELLRLPLGKLTEEYSTGMKKKLLLLSQLKQDKQIFILDEPFNGLDLETNKILEVIIEILNSRRKTVFISSHILDPLLHICTEIVLLREHTFLKTYNRDNFDAISEELFGNFSREIRNSMPDYI